MIRKLSLFALLMTFVVVVLGAYVRLSDAGLGCPDWPGCYGQLTPHHAADDIAAAQSASPHGSVSMPKAWKEMVHRYIASGLGLVILAIAFLSWRRDRERRTRTWLPVLLVGVVIFQGLLGKWTVTLLLKPAIVTLHLLGGLTVLAMLMWLLLRECKASRFAAGPRIALAARIALLLLAVQIALGGWVSTNYAALACTDFPTCYGSLFPSGMAFRDAFHVVRELGMTAEGQMLSMSALTAIHWSHRLGAMLIGGYLLVFAFRLARWSQLRGIALALIAGVILQIALGIANVMMSLPLALAVAHNAVAALLILIVVTVNYRLRAVRAGQAMTRIWNEGFVA